MNAALSVTSTPTPKASAAELGGHRLGELAVEVADRDPGALMRQRSRGRVADATRPAGDRDDLAGQRPRLPLLCLSMVMTRRTSLRSRWRGAIAQMADQELGLVADGVLERLSEVDVEVADRVALDLSSGAVAA